MLIYNGLKLFNSEQYEESLKVFLSIDPGKKEQGTVFYCIGINCAKLGYNQQAIEYLRKAISYFKSEYKIDYHIKIVLAYTYILEKDYQQSLDTLDNIFLGLLEDSEETKIISLKAYCLWALEKVDESIILLKKSLKIYPDNYGFLNSLGYILADKNMELDFALELCTKAAEAKPNNSAYLDSLGLVYLKRKEYVKSKIYLLKALELKPDNEYIKKHYNQLKKEMGDD